MVCDVCMYCYHVWYMVYGICITVIVYGIWCTVFVYLLFYILATYGHIRTPTVLKECALIVAL